MNCTVPLPCFHPLPRTDNHAVAIIWLLYREVAVGMQPKFASTKMREVVQYE
jgi:hypothetical protein